MIRTVFALTIIAMMVPAPHAFPQSASRPRENLMHVQNSFDLVVHASYAETAPLFGPEGERAWAGKHWDPQFVHPLPARDVAGAVFTIRHGPYSAVWVTTQFDLEARHIQYAYFLQNLMVTTIDVRFKPIDPSTTGVSVVYTRTAVTPEGNEHVTAMSEGDKDSGKDWQDALDKYLASHNSATRP
jgi:hypothetical protein